MDREEIEKKARNVLGAAGDMAAQGAEWLKNRDWKRYGENARNVANDMKQCIYGKPGDEPPSDKGFVTFSAFRFMVTPALARILWFVGAYIAYPIIMYKILSAMFSVADSFRHKGDVFWNGVFGTVLISIACLMVFRLLLELFVHVSRIHYSSKLTVELLEKLVAIEKDQMRDADGDGDSAKDATAKGGANA